MLILILVVICTTFPKNVSAEELIGSVITSNSSNQSYFKEIKAHEIKPLRTDGGYMEYKYVKTLKSYDTFVGYHPDFSEWKYVSGYYFSSTKKKTFTPSFQVSWGDIISASISVDVTANNSSGYIIDADITKKADLVLGPILKQKYMTHIFMMNLED